MRHLLNQLYNGRKYLQRSILQLLLIVLASGLVAAPAHAIGVYQMPKVSSGEPTWVIDKAEFLSRLTEGKLSDTLESLAKKTGNEVRIVTVHRLDYGETPESFTNALFEKWFPTAESQAHQTLLVIDTVTNGTAIRTGGAIKSILPDDIAKSVASETVVVPLRDGNKYNQGLLDASDRLVAVLSGQPDPGPPVVEQKEQVAGYLLNVQPSTCQRSTLA